MAYSPASSTFPTALTSFTSPVSTSDTSDFDHAGLESAQNSGISALENAVGITGSTDTNSLTYKLTSSSQSNPGHKHTLAQGATDITKSATIVNAVISTEHNDDGTHKSAVVTTLKATGAEVTTGTSDLKIVTPKALADAGITVTATSTTTLTNKRITKRVQSVSDAATITPNADTDDCVDITAIAQAFTIANPSGTPTNFQPLIIRIKDNGTARAITWGNGYVAGGTALPTTTVLSKILTIGFFYNTANSLNKWQCVAASQEA